MVIDDGSDADIGGHRVATTRRWPPGHRSATSPARTDDDVYIIYTGGTTGYPKGVMWRHEDVWRTLGGGIDFLTGVPLADEWEQSRAGRESAGWSGSARRR